MPERRRLLVLGVSLVATLLVLSVSVLAARSEAPTLLPVEVRGCRLLGAAYLPGFDLPQSQVAVLQSEAIARFSESTDSEVRSILQDPTEERWVRLGAWCTTNHGDDHGVRTTRYPT